MSGRDVAYTARRTACPRCGVPRFANCVDPAGESISRRRRCRRDGCDGRVSALEIPVRDGLVYAPGPLTDAFLTVASERPHAVEARDAWAMWDRMFVAYRRLYGEALDLCIDSRWWI